MLPHPSPGEWAGGTGCLSLLARCEGEGIHCTLQGHQLHRQGAAGGRKGRNEEGEQVVYRVRLQHVSTSLYLHVQNEYFDIIIIIIMSSKVYFRRYMTS